jgi:hypothetical protein
MCMSVYVILQDLNIFCRLCKAQKFANCFTKNIGNMHENKALYIVQIDLIIDHINLLNSSGPPRP